MKYFIPYSCIMYVNYDTKMKGAKNYYWIKCNSNKSWLFLTNFYF